MYTHKTQDQLWINGYQVASHDVTDDQYYSTFTSSATTLVTGQSTSDQEFAANAIAAYAHALNEKAIMEQYKEGVRTAGTENLSPSQKGEIIPLGANSIFLETTWDDNSDWNSGIISTLAIADNMLLPDVDTDGISLPGTWLNSVALDVAGDTTIYGGHLTWDGQRIIVETSLDGQTWFTASNGQKLQSIPQGTVTSGVDVEVRVSFAGGYSDGSEYLSSLTFTGYTASTTVSNTRTVSVEGPAALRPAGDVFELRDDEGIFLDGGRVVISADSADDAIQVKTLEVWAKSIGSSNFSLSSPVTTTYVNGVSTSGGSGGLLPGNNQPGTIYPDSSGLAISGTGRTPGAALPPSATLEPTDTGVGGAVASRRGEWIIIHFVASSGITFPLTINGDLIVGRVVGYPTAFTANQVLESVRAVTGFRFFKVSCSTPIGLSLPPKPATIYNHDWAVIGGGG